MPAILCPHCRQTLMVQTVPPLGTMVGCFMCQKGFAVRAELLPPQPAAAPQYGNQPYPQQPSSQQQYANPYATQQPMRNPFDAPGVPYANPPQPQPMQSADTVPSWVPFVAIGVGGGLGVLVLMFLVLSLYAPRQTTVAVAPVAPVANPAAPATGATPPAGLVPINQNTPSITPPAAKKTDGWQRFPMENSGISCELPGTPILQAIPGTGRSGHVLDRKTEAYVVMRTTLPMGQNQPTPQEVLRVVIDGMKQTRVKFLSESSINLGEHSGIEFTCKDAGAYMHARFFIIRGSLCQFIYSSGRSSQSANATRFLNSVQVD